MNSLTIVITVFELELKCSYYITDKAFIALLTTRINVVLVSHTFNLSVVLFVVLCSVCYSLCGQESI